MDAVSKVLKGHPSYAIGESTADSEIAKGRLGYRDHGKLVSWWRDAAALLLERYDLHFTVVGECITDMDIAAEAAGYNSRMVAEIQARFGHNVIESTFREVERKRKKHRR